MSSCDRSLHDGLEVACAFLVRPVITTSDRFDPNPTFQVPEPNHVFFACCADIIVEHADYLTKESRLAELHKAQHPRPLKAERVRIET